MVCKYDKYTNMFGTYLGFDIMVRYVVFFRYSRRKQNKHKIAFVFNRGLLKIALSLNKFTYNSNFPRDKNLPQLML